MGEVVDFPRKLKKAEVKIPSFEPVCIHVYSQYQDNKDFEHLVDGLQQQVLYLAGEIDVLKTKLFLMEVEHGNA